MNKISRRDLLKFAGLGTLATVLPYSLRAQTQTSAASAPKPRANSGIHRFTVGDWEAFSLAAGLFKMPNPHGLFAPQASAEDFKKALEQECLPTDSLTLHLNVLLLRKGSDILLIDAGLPGSQPEPFDLRDNLASIGLKASDITAVFLTHAHFDHMGGMLDKQGKPVFSGAQHFCLEQEYAFWTGANPDFSTSRADAAGIKGGIAGARRTFEAIKFTTLKDGARPFDGVSVIHAPGHTPGHMNLRIESKGQVLHHIADLAHHFAIMLPHPEWTVHFDIDEPLAARTRKAVLAKIAAEGTPVYGYHLPTPGIGRIKAEGAGYRWIQRLWETGT